MRRRGGNFEHLWVIALRARSLLLTKVQTSGTALCPEFDVASQGASIEQATANLREAVELFLECADPQEIAKRQRGEVYVTRFEAVHG